MKMLTTQQWSDIKGCSPQYIRKIAKAGKIQCITTINKRNKPEYSFDPRVVLAPRELQKYYNDRKIPSATALMPTKAAAKPFDNFTADEREEIVFWKTVIEQWQSFRNNPKAKSKAKADDDFIAYCKVQYPNNEFSTDTLYRRWKALRENNLDGLVDSRGKWKKGKSSIDEITWQAYLSFYLDEAQHPMKRCYEYTKLYLKEECPELLPEIPSYTTFYRRTQNDIPEAIEVLGRKGEKAFRDRCAPYIKRVYDEMASNEWWVADTHTFDVMTMGENGKPHRLYLTALFDARSGIFTGCHVTLNPCSQSVLIALRKGILKYGIPDNIYVDNGREFLTFDIGGLGHRTKKLKSGEERFTPPPIFERLGIKMTNAIVRNAKAKIIERRFRDVKDHLSRLFETYTGGHVLDRPEKLKKVLKDGKITLDAEFIETVETLLEWHFNQQEYGGAVAEDRSKPRMQVFNEQLHSKRVASAEELNLMLMRSTRPQKVTRRGVNLKLGGQQLDYWNDDLLANFLGEQVYFRYDPEDLSEVRIYNLEDKYIMSVEVDNEAVAKYGADKEAVKRAISKTKQFEKITKQALKVSGIPAYGKRTAMELILADAYESKEANLIPNANPTILRLTRFDEEPLFQDAVGFANLDVINRNARNKQGGNIHE